MAKTKTSKKLKKSKPVLLKEIIPFSDPDFKDIKIVSQALVECLMMNDLESFRDVLIVHLMTVNKMNLAKKSGLGRRTLYDIIDPKKTFNPELSTVAALLHALAA